jgi:hypothetical protein
MNKFAVYLKQNKFVRHVLQQQQQQQQQQKPPQQREKCIFETDIENGFD